MTTSSPSNRSTVPIPRLGSRWVWLGMAFAGAALVAAIIGCFFAVLALLRPSVPRTYEIHLTTDSMPRTVSLAEEIRADGGLRGEGLMAGIIALINDTRKSLAGMETARSGSRQSPAPEE